MDLKIPEPYYLKLLEYFSVEEWRNFFQHKKQYQSFLKGFRPHKVPSKILKTVVLKLLKNKIKFLEDVLKKWNSTQSNPLVFSIYRISYLEKNWSTYQTYLGKEQCFWLGFSDSQKEIKELAIHFLKAEESLEELPQPELSSFSNFKIIVETEQKIKDIQEIKKNENALDHPNPREKFSEQEQAFLKKKLKKKSEKIIQLREKNQKLMEELDCFDQKNQKLKKEKFSLETSFPKDFIPCSLVVSLEKRLQSLEKNLPEHSKFNHQIQEYQEKEMELKKTHAELLQKLRALQEEKENYKIEMEHYQKMVDISSKLEKKKKEKPPITSTKQPSQKIIWPSLPHHYPKRLKSFLEKISRNNYIHQIYLLGFENSAHSRIKSISSDGNLLLLFSDGQKAIKIFIKNTAKNIQEGLYIEGELLTLETSLQGRKH